MRLHTFSHLGNNVWGVTQDHRVVIITEIFQSEATQGKSIVAVGIAIKLVRLHTFYGL